MFKYNWFITKHYLIDKELIKDVKITYWQHLPILNYSSHNFYFLINSFFLKNPNTPTLLISSFLNSNLKNYSSNVNKLKLIPSKLNFSMTDISFITDFIYLKNFSFIKFFINNMIDVPICFKKSSSLKTKNFELPLLKFSNFLMKKGKRDKIFKILFNSFRNFFNSLKIEKFQINKELYSFFTLYNFTTNAMFYYSLKEKKKFIFNTETNIPILYNNYFLNNHKMINVTFFLKNFLYSLLSQVSPVFSYFIYSVDKNIRKFSRGKSGKYTFIWKYIAPYKRINLSMRWILKDIKFHHGQKLDERLIKTLESLMINPEKSFAWKSKVFSYNYVFKNFRKSLMSSLRTTS